MEQKNMQTPFTKAFMTALFVGIVTSVICLIYNGIYRDETRLEPTDIINVGSIIFAVNILFLVVGIIFYIMRLMKGPGELIYIAGFILLTAFLGWKAEGVIRSSNEEVTVAFRGLLLGIIVIIGFSASLVVPFLFHSKKFEQNIL